MGTSSFARRIVPEECYEDNYEEPEEDFAEETEEEPAGALTSGQEELQDELWSEQINPAFLSGVQEENGEFSAPETGEEIETLFTVAFAALLFLGVCAAVISRKRRKLYD